MKCVHQNQVNITKRSVKNVIIKTNIKSKFHVTQNFQSINLHNQMFASAETAIID